MLKTKERVIYNNLFNFNIYNYIKSLFTERDFFTSSVRLVVRTLGFHSSNGGSNPPSDTMTREEKNKKRKALGVLRKEKKRAKDKLYMKIALENGESSVSWGRRKLQGRVWQCTMNYVECNLSGYCNGDC